MAAICAHRTAHVDVKRTVANRGTKLLQTVRKVASRPKNVARNPTISDFSRFDRPQTAKIRPSTGIGDRLTDFSRSLETCTCEPVSPLKVRSLIRCADGWPRTGDVERVKKWPSWKPIACFYARSLPQAPMISFGIGSTPLPRAVARARTRNLFERH